MVNTILAKRVNHIVAKGDNPAWPKGSKSRGFSTVYKCELDSVQRIAGDNEPYQVEFSSTLTIHSVSGQKLKFLIRTRGELVRTTPQFPENVTGFFFSQFLQQIIRIEQPLKQ